MFFVLLLAPRVYGQEGTTDSSLEVSVKQALEAYLGAEHEVLMAESIISTDWIYGGVATIDTTYPTLYSFIAHKAGENWQIAFEPQIEFYELVAQAPDAVIGTENKELIKKNSEVSAQGLGSAQLSLPFSAGEAWPIAGPHPNIPGENNQPWNSLDFLKNNGEVRAARDGIVSNVFCNGALVTLRHSGGWFTGYFHLSNTQVSKNQSISRGQLIGYTSQNLGGCSGSATAQHVHFTLSQGSENSYVNIQDHSIGGWIPFNGGSAYGGGMKFWLGSWQEVGSGGAVMNYGLVGCDGTPCYSAGSLSGRVMNNGQPVSGATVKYQQGHYSLSTNTDGSGFYSFLSAPAGSGIVSAFGSSGSGEVSVTVNANQSVSAPNINLNIFCSQSLNGLATQGDISTQACGAVGPDNSSLVSQNFGSGSNYVTPGGGYIKVWRIKNNGQSTWTGYKIAFVSGNRLGGAFSINAPALTPGQEADVSMGFTVPNNTQGIQTGYWQLKNTAGTYFGAPLPLTVQAPNSQTGGSSGNGSTIDLVSVDMPSSLSAGQSFRPSVTVRVNGGQLREDRGDMLRFYSGTNITSPQFPHVAVSGVVNAGNTYSFVFYQNNPMVAPSGSFDSVWRVWANGGWVGPEIHITNTGYGANQNKPPNKPNLVSPGDWSVYVGQQPTLCASQNGDPDGDAVNQYMFDVFDSAQLWNSGWVNTSCATTSGLSYFGYQWRVKVRDSRGGESAWSDSRHFTINDPNVTVTRFDFSMGNPGPEQTKVYVCSSGGTNVGLILTINTANDGSTNGEWVNINHLPTPCSNENDAPVLLTREQDTGNHIVRLDVGWGNPQQHRVEDRVLNIPVSHPPSEPVAQFPSKQMSLNSRTVNFSWKQSFRAASYRLRVATNEGMSNIVLDQSTTSTSLNHTFGSDYAKLYWTISAVNGVGYTITYDAGWFSVDTTPPVGTVIPESTDGVEYDTAFAIAWSSNETTKTFDIQVADPYATTWTDWLTDYPYGSAVYQGQPGHTYCFRVRARDLAGNLGTYPEQAQDCVKVDPTGRPAESWWNNSYAYKRSIVITNRGDATIPSGYPILLKFDSTTSPTFQEMYNSSQSATKGYDIRIVNGLTELPRTFVPGSSPEWRIYFPLQQELAVNSSISYDLYYGNPNASDPPNLTYREIYQPRIDGSTEAIWYMEVVQNGPPGGTGFIGDDTENNRFLTTYGNPDSGPLYGKHGKGIRFNGGQWAQTPSFNTGDHLTVEGWVNFQEITYPTNMGLFSKSDGQHSWKLELIPEGGRERLRGEIVYMDLGGTPHQVSTVYGGPGDSNGFFVTGKWYHFAMTYDGSSLKLWLNGEVISQHNGLNGRIVQDSEPIYIGRADMFYQPIRAYFDGVAVSSVAKTSFPYAKVFVEPMTGVGDQVSQQAAFGPSDLTVTSVQAFPGGGTGYLAQVTVQNLGVNPTGNELFIHLYDRVPAGPLDLAGSMGVWVNQSIPAGSSVSLVTPIVSTATLASLQKDALSGQSTTVLSAQVDSTNAVSESNESNNIFTGSQVCSISPDQYEDDAVQGNAVELVLNVLQARNFHSSSDFDYVWFRTTSGKKYSVRTFGLEADADTVLYLHRFDGTNQQLLTQNDDYAGSKLSNIVFTATANEGYWAEVKEWNPGSTGGCAKGYKLILEEVKEEGTISTPIKTTYLPIILK